MRYPMLYVAVTSGLAHLSVSATAQNTPAQFNLTCIGRQFVGEAKDFKREDLWETFVIIYRIDLETNRWCSDKCLETFEISHINSKEIFLAGSPEDKWEEVHYFTKLNRETGKMTSNSSLGRNLPIIFQTADCLREPFEGFPPRRF